MVERKGKCEERLDVPLYSNLNYSSINDTMTPFLFFLKSNPMQRLYYAVLNRSRQSNITFLRIPMMHIAIESMDTKK